MRQLTDEQLASKLWHIPANGEPEPLGSKFPTLDELQRGVGGYIDHVLCHFHGAEAHLYVNDEGHREGLPLNGFATLLYAAHELTTADEIVAQLVRGVRPNVFATNPILGDVLLWLGPLPASELE